MDAYLKPLTTALLILLAVSCVHAAPMTNVAQQAPVEILNVPEVFYGMRASDSPLWVCGLEPASDAGTQFSCVNWADFDKKMHESTSK